MERLNQFFLFLTSKMPAIRLFNLDLHVSVIEDIKDIANRIFGEKIEITNWSISGHNWVFNKPQPPPTPINQETWKNISPQMIEDFQELFDEMLETYDGFIVTHTPVLCMLFEKYKKPILCINTCRYDQPFCWNNNGQSKEWLNTGLKRMIDNKQLTIISNNRADYNYLLHGSGISSNVIPSLCLYTKENYNPQPGKKFILHGERSHVPPCNILLEKPKNHSWKELYEFEGIVHMPYEMSTMSIFEQLFAGVPLFFPTKRFYKECLIHGTMSFISCYNKWNSGITQDDFDIWTGAADFYLFPYMYYYDSWEDLFQQLSSFTDPNREARQIWIESVKKGVHEAWKGTFEHLFPALKN